MKALGRIQNHDERSRAYQAALGDRLRTGRWDIPGDILDQGKLGACVGNTATYLLRYLLKNSGLNEGFAVNLYEQATLIDPFPGAYPPDDTGTDMLSMAKVLQQLGYIKAYRHAFGIHQMLRALQLGPVAVGTVWTENMFRPNRWGTVFPKGEPAGGHEYTAYGYVHRYYNKAGFPLGWVWFRNSWGVDWGMSGNFRMSTSALDYLLKQGGDVMVLEA